jgi:hypothetical protein
VISYEQAAKILDVAGGSIRYWAENITDIRATQRVVIEPGDVLELQLTAPGPGAPGDVTLTPYLLQRLVPSGTVVEEITPEVADQLVQIAVFGGVKHTDVPLSDDERALLDEALAGMPVRDDED